MLPKTGRFYVHGTSPKILVTNTEDSLLHVQLWQTHDNEDGTAENTNVYFSFDKETCTLSKGTPLPEGGTIIRFILPPGQSIYGVSDDQGRGGWIAQKVAVGRG